MRRIRLWLRVGFSTGFSHGGGWLKGNELCRSPCPPSQHSPKCASSWCLELICDPAHPPASCHLSASQVLSKEGLCPWDCGQTPAPGCCTREAAAGSGAGTGARCLTAHRSRQGLCWCWPLCVVLLSRPTAQHPEEVLWPFLCPAHSHVPSSHAGTIGSMAMAAAAG